MRRRKTFLFAFLVLSLLLAACVRSGGTEGENSYTIYDPAAELRDGQAVTILAEGPDEAQAVCTLSKMLGA